MTKKATILLPLLLFSLFGSIAVATGQDSTNPSIALSSTTINFYGKEGTAPENRNFTVFGLDAENINVTLVSSKLYTNGTAEGISVKLTPSDSFNVSKTIHKLVTIELDSPRKEGIYNGKITVFAVSAKGNVTATSLTLVASIEDVPFFGFDAIKLITVFAIGLLIFAGLVFPDDWQHISYLPNWIKTKIAPKTKIIISKKLIVVGIGVVVAFLWFLSVLYFSFGDPASVLQAILIAPFLTYAVGIVKDKRSERLEKEKVSRGIRDKGIENDIELIRNLIGEMATHCASFRPNFYEEKLKKPFDSTLQLIYPKTGFIAKKVWEESCRQGFVADIHTLHLEKYYDLIPFYNQCYSHAMSKAEKEKKTPDPNNNFLDQFKAFRQTYGELQEVLFVYLTYTLELYSKTTLSPMKLEYPRITRTLLYTLIEYNLLNPFEFIDDLSAFKTENIAEELVEKEIDNELDNLDSENTRLKNEIARLKTLKTVTGITPKRTAELDKQIKQNTDKMEKLVEPIKLLETLKTELHKNKDEQFKRDLIEKSKKQFNKKTDLKKDFKKNRPDLKEDDDESIEAFKEYTLEKITHLKTDFKKANPTIPEDTKKFSTTLKKYVDTSNSPLKKDYDLSEAIELWVTMKFKEKIEWWRFIASDLETIVDYIYAADRIPHFYRHMQNDFQKTYLKLKESIKAISDDGETIPPLQKDPDIKDYKIYLGNIPPTENEDETKKDENKPTSKPKPKPKPDPFMLDLETRVNVDVQKKP